MVRGPITGGAVDIKAPVVFAGYGVSDPALGIDDHIAAFSQHARPRAQQNARLAARLTGVRIDIRGETQVPEGEFADAEYEEGEWVANPESGEMEWHAADGSVMTQDQWNAQAAGDAPVADAAEPEPEPARTEPAQTEPVEEADGAAEIPATQGAGDNAAE